MFLSRLNIINKVFAITDRFFRGTQVDIYITDEADREFVHVNRNSQMEWVLNQDMSDIISRDLLILFKCFTPYFIRKAIIKINYLVLIYLKTDEELNDEYKVIDKQYFNSDYFNQKIRYFTYSRIIPKLIKLSNITLYPKPGNRTISMILIMKSQVKFVSNRLLNYFRLFNLTKVQCALTTLIRGPAYFKLISHHLFHKRN